MTVIRKRAVLGAAVVALLLALSTWLVVRPGGGAARLMWRTDAFSASGNGAPGPVVTTWLFGGMDPCVDHGSVTVTGFSFTRADNLTIVAWGHRPNTFATGAMMHGGTSHQSIQSLFATTPVSVTDACADVRANRIGPGGRGSEFAITVRRASTATGWGDGLSVTYRSGGRSHVSHWPLGFILCGTDGIRNAPSAFDHFCST